MAEITTRFEEFEPQPMLEDGPNRRMGKRRAEWLVSAANSNGGEPAEALDQLLRRGPSATFLEEIFEALGDVQQCSKLQLDKKNKRFVWAPVENQQSIKVLTELCLVSIINAGLSKQIKRCASKQCRQFLFGDPRKKWCSDSCGSLVRVQEKRKLDRERVML